MTWCSHRKGVNEGLSAAAALPAAIKADVLLLLLLFHLLSPPSPAFPFCASGTGRGETGKHCSGCVRVCVSERLGEGVLMCMCGVCHICWWGWGVDSRSVLLPQLLSQIGALYTHVPPAFGPSFLHNTSSAAEDMRKCDPNPPNPNWVRG